MVAITLAAAAIGAAAGALGLVSATIAGSSILAGALIYGGIATAQHFLIEGTRTLPTQVRFVHE